MNYQKNTLNIKSWAEDDRPREKMLKRGKQNLSDVELLAILIGSGSRKETAVGLSQRILKSFENNLNQLGKSSLAELMRFNGIGEAKAITIAASLELGRRRQLSDFINRTQILSSKDGYHCIAPILMDLNHEEFWIILLNRANKVIGKERISAGGVSGTVVDAKIVFRKALEGNPASSIILCHNHPSGNNQPSQADIDLTKKLKEAGTTLDILILDHLIIAESGYYSFADKGML